MSCHMYSIYNIKKSIFKNSIEFKKYIKILKTKKYLNEEEGVGWGWGNLSGWEGATAREPEKDMEREGERERAGQSGGF